jgi:hypothetical protein
MRSISIALMAFLLPQVSGCGLLLNKWESENSFAVAAEPLNRNLVDELKPPVQPSQKKELIGKIVDDSEEKCGRFLNGLVLSETSTNTGLDIFTTIFSALGTAFTPVSTIHAMAAGATITSGSKTAIDSNIYARASIANFAQAIQASYYKNINSYLLSLNSSNESELIITIEFGKILTIHKECSLASAEATISSTIANPPAASTPNDIDKWTIADKIKKGDQLSLIAHSATFTESNNDITTQITAKSNNPIDLAKEVVNGINLNPQLSNKGISASKSDGKTFDLISPHSAGVTWRVDGAGKADLQHTATAQAPNPASSSGTGQELKPPSSGVTTKGVVPGSAL